MVVKEIVKVIHPKLYSVNFNENLILYGNCIEPKGDKCNELCLFLDLVDDIFYIKNLYKENIDKIKNFCSFHKITLLSEYEFQKYIVSETNFIYIALQEFINMEYDLKTIFQNLDDNIIYKYFNIEKTRVKYIFSEMKEIKTKEMTFKININFIRLYGINLEEGQYCITGGGIKFVRSIQEDKLLDFEMNKAIKVRDYYNSLFN